MPSVVLEYPTLFAYFLPLPFVAGGRLRKLVDLGMPSVQALESFHEALEPLEALQSEQAELGTWIHDSFSALEKLHEELTQWQSELARKETELDLRQDSLSKSKTAEKGLQKQVEQLEQQLAIAKEELQQLEDESVEQLQELENFESRFTQLEADYEIARDRVTELEITLAAERERAALSGEWKQEFQDLHGILESGFQTLAMQLEKALPSGLPSGHESHTPLSAGAAHAKSAELRRRAQSRREAKERKDPPANEGE